MKIGLIIFVAAVLVFALVRAMITHFECPNCGQSFKANIFVYIFTVHFINKRMVTCPNCGKTGMLSPKWDKNKK